MSGFVDEDRELTWLEGSELNALRQFCQTQGEKQKLALIETVV